MILSMTKGFWRILLAQYCLKIGIFFPEKKDIVALASCAVYFPTSIEFVNTEKLYFMIVENGFII